MPKVRQFLCRIGIHQWNEWNEINIDLVPMGDFGMPAIGINLDSLELETRERSCKHCNAGQVRQTIKW